MKEFHPHIIVSGISHDNSERMKKVLRLVEAKFVSMGIRVFFAPENFSLEEVSLWAKDIADNNDFFLNFSFDENPKVYFKSETEKELADIMKAEISRRSDIDYEESLPLSQWDSPTGNFLQDLPFHSLNIQFSPHKNDVDLKMNILACVTDICFLPHSLLEEQYRWAFRDVPAYHFASSAIKKAKKEGIIPGYKGDIIYPNGGITRGEVIYMLDKIGKLL
jgi:hypothetical protein